MATRTRCFTGIAEMFLYRHLHQKRQASSDACRFYLLLKFRANSGKKTAVWHPACLHSRIDEAHRQSYRSFGIAPNGSAARVTGDPKGSTDCVSGSLLLSNIQFSADFPRHFLYLAKCLTSGQNNGILKRALHNERYETTVLRSERRVSMRLRPIFPVFGGWAAKVHRKTSRRPRERAESEKPGWLCAFLGRGKWGFFRTA